MKLQILVSPVESNQPFVLCIQTTPTAGVPVCADDDPGAIAADSGLCAPDKFALPEVEPEEFETVYGYFLA